MESMVKKTMIFEQIFKQFFPFGQDKQKEDGVGLLQTPPTPPFEIKPAPKRYCLIGKPCSMARSRDLAFRGWTQQKSAVASCESQLLEQHHEEPLYSGLLHLEVLFYFKPTSASKIELYRGKLCKDGPRLDGLIKFVEKVCSNVICAEDSEIVSVYAKKLFDDNARTEFLITRY